MALTAKHVEVFPLNNPVRSASHALNRPIWALSGSNFNALVESNFLVIGHYFEPLDVTCLHTGNPTRSLHLGSGGLSSLFSVQRKYHSLMFIFGCFFRGFCQKACLSSINFSSISRTGQEFTLLV